jgi:hypothetical protein
MRLKEVTRTVRVHKRKVVSVAVVLLAICGGELGLALRSHAAREKEPATPAPEQTTREAKASLERLAR